MIIKSNQTLLISIDQSKLLDNKLRVKIFEMLLDRPKTSQQIASQIGESPENVHYHIEKLLQGKLIELVDEKRIGGVVAKYYSIYAKLFELVNMEGSELRINTVENSATKMQMSKQFKKEKQAAQLEVLRCKNILSRHGRFF